MKAKRIFSVVGDVFAVVFFALITAFPKYATIPTGNAVLFCAKTLVPSLFIYMILSKVIITLPLTDRLAKRFGIEPFMFVAGNLCGCPIGAKNAVSLYETGRIDKKHAEFLTSFTNNASVSFIIGFVGSELFGDAKVGLRLFVYQVVATFLTALIMKRLIFGKAKIPKAKSTSFRKIGVYEAITDSALTIINLCAIATFFMVCGSAISDFFGFDEFSEAILKSLLEFSSGCVSASQIGTFAVQITAFSVGFSGLSVAMQVKSVIGGKLRMMPFFTGKIITCTVMTVLSLIFG